MTALSTKFLRDETGQDLIEYGLLLGIITLSVLAAMNLIGPKIVAYFVNAEALLP
jgi:Flp pilus assembly pilin Flp